MRHRILPCWRLGPGPRTRKPDDPCRPQFPEFSARSKPGIAPVLGRDCSVQKSKKKRESCVLSAIIRGGDGCGMLTWTSKFKLRLLGPFIFVDPEGRRIVISSRKGAALLAMLAVSKDGERAR